MTFNSFAVKKDFSWKTKEWLHILIPFLFIAFIYEILIWYSIKKKERRKQENKWKSFNAQTSQALWRPTTQSSLSFNATKIQLLWCWADEKNKEKIKEISYYILQSFDSDYCHFYSCYYYYFVVVVVVVAFYLSFSCSSSPSRAILLRFCHYFYLRFVLYNSL